MMEPTWRPAMLGAFLVISAKAVAMPPHEGPPPLPPGRDGPPPLMALAGLERGLWELRERDVRGAPATRQCVRYPSQLVQARHPGARCRYFVIADRPGRAILSYQCENAGTGRTDLRVETPRLVQIESQGIAEGAPFSVSLEGRRVGDCR